MPNLKSAIEMRVKGECTLLYQEILKYAYQEFNSNPRQPLNLKDFFHKANEGYFPPEDLVTLGFFQRIEDSGEVSLNLDSEDLLKKLLIQKVGEVHANNIMELFDALKLLPLQAHEVRPPKNENLEILLHKTEFEAEPFNSVFSRLINFLKSKESLLFFVIRSIRGKHDTLDFLTCPEDIQIIDAQITAFYLALTRELCFAEKLEKVTRYRHQYRFLSPQELLPRLLGSTLYALFEEAKKVQKRVEAEMRPREVSLPLPPIGSLPFWLSLPPAESSKSPESAEKRKSPETSETPNPKIPKSVSDAKSEMSVQRLLN